MRKIIFKLTGLFLIILTTFYIIVKIFGFWPNIPDNNIYKIYGIDVSHHQGNIDWEKVKNSKIKFVYIKATEGGDHIDKNFHNNWNETKLNNIIHGGYHFFTLCKSGNEQAENFIKNVPKENNSLPPVVDLEFPGNCKNRPTLKEFESELNDFLTKIKNYYSLEPILYTNKEFYQEYLKTNFSKNRYWVRDIFGHPGSNLPNFIIWQYSEFEIIDGINGSVDINTITESNWEKIRHGT